MVILGTPGRILEALGTLLRPLGGVLGASWEDFGSLWGLFGGYVGAWKATLTRCTGILKNPEMHCKALQKSRFGGSDIHEKGGDFNEFWIPGEAGRA